MAEGGQALGHRKTNRAPPLGSNCGDRYEFQWRNVDLHCTAIPDFDDLCSCTRDAFCNERAIGLSIVSGSYTHAAAMTETE